MEYKLFYHSDKEYIAYDKYQANNNANNGILFLSGFKADMNGTKSNAIVKFARENEIDYVRFDYSGHGNSSGQFTQGTIGRWLNDALLVVDNILDDKKYVLVGSSMGGWIMLLLSILRPEKFVGLVGLAAAADFTEELIWNKLDENQRLLIEKNGIIDFGNEFCTDTYPISSNLIIEARKHLLLNKKNIPINLPIRLIHGMRDEDVPFDTAQRISDLVESNDVNVYLLKKAGHRLSEPKELELIFNVINEFI